MCQNSFYDKSSSNLKSKKPHTLLSSVYTVSVPPVNFPLIFLKNRLTRRTQSDTIESI